jgi:hypothetical protein
MEVRVTPSALSHFQQKTTAPHGVAATSVSVSVFVATDRRRNAETVTPASGIRAESDAQLADAATTRTVLRRPARVTNDQAYRLATVEFELVT